MTLGRFTITALTWVVGFALWAGGMVWLATSTDAFDTFTEAKEQGIVREPEPRARERDTRQHRRAERARRGKEASRPKRQESARAATEQDKSKRLAANARRGVANVGRALLLAVRLAFVIATPLCLLLLLSRWRARRRRRYVRLSVLPFRSEQSTPDDVRRLMESWHQQLLERWWRRIAFGQPSIALEVLHQPDAEGQPAGRLCVVCPTERVRSIEGGLLSCYPDSRLLREPAGRLLTVRRVVRLQKRYRFVRALRSPDEGQQRGIVDAVLSQMAALDTSTMLQYTLVPTPALFDVYSRWRFKRLERSSEAVRSFDPHDPGLRSEVLTQELKGGLRVQHRPLFFADIRVGGASYNECSAVAGVVRGESNAENRLVIRYMRPWGRGPLFIRWLNEGVADPIPDWSRGVLSSSELAGLWQFPSPGMKEVRMARSSVPRMPAPPEISRGQEHGLARDDYGIVGIRPEDKSDGLGLIGGQKTGKTSLLCRTVEADALDPECALVVLMPKPGDANKALSMVPRDRTVHYLDLERPEFGINPLLAEGDPAMVADKVVEAFRDVNMEGDIRGSSDRYLRQAAQASIGASRSGVVQGPPTLWHMYRMLLPSEGAFRDQVVASLLPDARFTDTASFFGRELPADLRDAATQTAAKLDAPRNKLLRLMVESLDKVLRHPRQLSLDALVRNKEVLIVDGKMGTFGTDNCRVMMQFILNSLYGALQRQQQRPEDQRARVALKVDEAHLIINESFADALATLRSAGLEVVAAWQYGGQIQDPKIRAGMMSLLRQRCMFSMGEAEDAREMSSIAMSVYTDMIRAEPESQANLRVTPDTIFNLPNHHAVCSWISRGARVPAFIGQTIPLDTDDDVIRHHVEAQHARGGYVPDRLPDPLPDLEWKGLRDLPSEPIGLTGTHGRAPANGGPPDLENPPTEELVFDPGGTSLDSSNERAREPEPASVPDSYTELEMDDVRGLIWDQVTPLPPDRVPEPSQRELDILGALWSYRVMFASQIWRRWWNGSSQRASQQALNRMTKAGWVRRFKLHLAERGAQQRVYCLTREGFDLARERTGPRGPYIDPDANWREPQISDPRRVLRSLHVNAWVLALEDVCGRALARWRGPSQSRLEPPRRRVRGEWLDLRPSDVTVGARTLRDYEAPKFEPVTPDATAELRLPMGDSSLRLDLLIEFDRVRSAAATEDRLVKYDGLISGWASMLDRYKALGTPPVLMLVCENERARDNLVKLADRVVTARLAKAGTEEADWRAPGRKAMFFALERDIHMGSLEALQLPEHPPDVRVKLGGPKHKKCHPWRVHIIEPRLLRRK